MLLQLASVTDSVVTVATQLIRTLGYAGVSVMTASSGVIGIPGSEPTMLFAGFNVFQGHLTLLGIIVFGVVGDLLGATIAYAIGYFGQRELLERQRGKLHLSPEQLDRAHGWFARYGSAVIVVTRCVPVLRAVFPYAAGVARMPYLRFISLATLGSIVWIAGFGLLGNAVGSSWPSWRHSLQYADYAFLVLVVLAVGYVIVKRRGARARGAFPDALA